MFLMRVWRIRTYQYIETLSDEAMKRYQSADFFPFAEI